jgi:hypothetical protein
MKFSWRSSLLFFFFGIASQITGAVPGGIQDLQVIPGDSFGGIQVMYTNPTTGVGSITSREVRIKVEGSSCSLQVVRGGGWNCPLVMGIIDPRGTFGSSQVLMLPIGMLPNLDTSKKYQIAIRLRDSTGAGPVSNVVGMKWVRLAWDSVLEASQYRMYFQKQYLLMEEDKDAIFGIETSTINGLLGGLLWGTVHFAVTASEEGGVRESFFSDQVTDHR